LEWLRLRYANVNAQHPKFRRLSNGYFLTFDFAVSSEHWIIELDGDIPNGHFDPAPSNECPVRDIEKEQWALQHGWQVIRVLQEDVWYDRNGWDNYLTTQIAEWNRRRLAGEAPRKAITPQAPAYLGGVYYDLRRVVDTAPLFNDDICGLCGVPLCGERECLRCGAW
jgi:very-short-patch-repair endonuclease